MSIVLELVVNLVVKTNYPLPPARFEIFICAVSSQERVLKQQSLLRKTHAGRVTIPRTSQVESARTDPNRMEFIKTNKRYGFGFASPIILISF